MKLPKLPKLNLPSGVWPRIAWLFEGFNRYHVAFVGPSAAGKTQVGICLWKSDMGTGADPSKGLINQYNTSIVKTLAQSKVVASREAATSNKIEYLDSVRLPNGRVLRMLFWPAETLAAGPNQSRAFRSLREVAPRGSVVIVLNPFGLDETLATRALLGSIAFLQRKHALSFTDALVESAAILFAIENEASVCRFLTRGSSIDSDSENAAKIPETIAAYFGEGDIDAVRIELDRTYSEPGPEQFIYQNCPPNVGRKLADAVISRLAKVYVQAQFPEVRHVLDWIDANRSRHFMIVFTRRDVVEELDGLDAAEFEQHCTSWAQEHKLGLQLKDMVVIGLLKVGARYTLKGGGTAVTREMAMDVASAEHLASWLVDSVGDK